MIIRQFLQAANFNLEIARFDSASIVLLPIFTTIVFLCHQNQIVTDQMVINCFGFQVKMEGFDLLSKESVALQNKQSSTSMEGDAWIISLHEAENLLLVGGARKKVLSILKTIRDRHLDLQVLQV